MRISTAPNATPRSTPPSSRGSRGGADPQAGDEQYIWTSLVPRLIHPARLAIIEALIEADEPQSVDDLILIPAVEGTSEEIQSHATDMVELGALEITSIQIHAGTEVPLYFFPRQAG